MKPGPARAVITQVSRQFDLLSEFLRDTGVRLRQMVREVRLRRGNRQKERFAPIARSPLLKEADTVIHHRKRRALVLGLRRIAPERRAASDQPLFLPVVVVLGELVGKVARFRIIGLALHLRVRIKTVGAARLRVDRPQVPLAKITDVVPESSGPIDPGALRQRRRKLLRVSHRVVVGDARVVRPAPRQQRAPRRRTQRAGRKSVAEDRPLSCQPVDIGRGNLRPAKTESRSRPLVRQDKKDILRAHRITLHNCHKR